MPASTLPFRLVPSPKEKKNEDQLSPQARLPGFCFDRALVCVGAGLCTGSKTRATRTNGAKFATERAGFAAERARSEFAGAQHTQ